MTTAQSAAKPSSPKKSMSSESGSLHFISQMVGTGLADSFDSLKQKVSASITDNGEQYLHDAIDRLKKSTGDLVGWSKKNPVKTAVAVAAVLAVTAFLVTTARGGKAKAAGKVKKTAAAKPKAAKAVKKATSKNSM